MDKKVLYIIFIMFFVLQSESFFANADTYNPSPAELLRNNVKILYVPSGVKTDVILSQKINSNSAIIGQTVNAILIQDFKYQNTVIAPCGSIFEGSVVYNKKANLMNKQALMQIRFTKIRTPYNNIVPINAVVETTDSNGIIKGTEPNFKNPKNKDVDLSPNTKLTLVFDQPITVGAQ